jgi:RNA polymerase sigma factor (TIGR02999 family)
VDQSADTIERNVEDVTSLLRLTSEGRKDLDDELFRRVYRELRQIAGGIFHSSPMRQDPILQPTALVNEAYLRLLGSQAISWNSRVHFFNVAAVCMRRILLDAARARYRDKRGGKLHRVDLDDSILIHQEHPERLIAIDDAMQELQQADPRCAEVVHLRFFLGFTVDETAELLQVSPKTVKRDWEFARVWLETKLLPN